MTSPSTLDRTLPNIPLPPSLGWDPAEQHTIPQSRSPASLEVQRETACHPTRHSIEVTAGE
jgi:hypothetical protein